MSGTSVGSDVGKQDMGKRKVILTEKALANKIESIQKERKRKVDEIKTVISSMKELMKDGIHVSAVKGKLDGLMKLSHTSNELHASLMPLIPHDEQEKPTGWFSKVIKHKDDFIEDVNAWFSVTRLRGSPSRPLLVANRSNESPLLHEAAEEENGGVENVEVTGPQSHNVQDDIQPDDSISNYSSQNHGSKSIRSKVSSTASARVRAEAEMAALIARKRLLEQKHALEEEEAKIRHALQEQEARVRKQKEQLQLETDMAASAAKLNVLRTSGSGVRSVASQKLDGMEVYFESGLNFNAETFVRQNVGDVGRGQPAEFGGTRPKQRQCDGNKHLQRTSAPTQAQSTVPKATGAPLSLHRHTQSASGNISSEQDTMMSIMQKQNDITSMLVHQQCIASLPKRDIQLFDGDPLHYHAFRQSFEQTIELRTDC